MNRTSTGVIGTVGLIITCACIMGLDDGKPTPPPAKPASESKPESPAGGGPKELDALRGDLGEWDAKVTFWFKPDAAPVETTAVVTNTMTLDGMYMKTTIEKGTFGPAMGNKAWSSVSYTGFNTTTKEFEAVRMASTSSTMIVVQGPLGADGKTIELKGEYLLMGMKATSRDVLTSDGPERRVLDSYMSFGGSPEFRGFRMEMTKRK